MANESGPRVEKFQEIWNGSSSAKEAAERLGMGYGATRGYACYWRARGLRLKKFGPSKKPQLFEENDNMGAPNEVLTEHMRQGGYVVVDKLAKDMGFASSYVVRLANKAGDGALIPVGRFRFVHAERVKAQKAREDERMAQARALIGIKSRRSDKQATAAQETMDLNSLVKALAEAVRVVVREEINAAFAPTIIVDDDTNTNGRSV